jgi:two-component system CheB/CheR fusion protein
MSGMPRSAAATGLVDHVTSAENLPAKLLEHQAHLAKVEERKEADGRARRYQGLHGGIMGVLRKRLKHDFGGYKPNTMIWRIQRRVQVLQICYRLCRASQKRAIRMRCIVSRTVKSG